MRRLVPYGACVHNRTPIQEKSPVTLYCTECVPAVNQFMELFRLASARSLTETKSISCHRFQRHYTSASSSISKWTMNALTLTVMPIGQLILILADRPNLVSLCIRSAYHTNQQPRSEPMPPCLLRRMSKFHDYVLSLSSP